MEIMGILLNQIALMFIFIGIGYVLYRSKLISNAGVKDLGTLLLYIVLPCVIIKAYLSDRTEARMIGLAISFAASLISLIIAMLISQFIFGKRHRIENFGTAFSNAGFIGIPLIQAVLGEEAVFYVSSYVALLNIFQWMRSSTVLREDPEPLNAKKLVSNPLLIGMVIGLLLFITQLPLPGLVKTSVAQLASVNTPVAMIIIGTYLAQVEWGDLFTDKLSYASCVVRLVLIPAVTFAVLSLVPNEYYMIKMTVLIAASAPVGSNVAIFAQRYGLSYTQAVKSVCLSTILSIVSLPAIVFLASRLWGA